MSDDIVERVSKAICESLEADVYDDLSEDSIVKAAYRQQARAAIEATVGRADWRDIRSAPRDGTWVLLRGRNAVGQPMIPVVAAWCPPAAKSHGWADSGSLRPVDTLAADDGADWCAIPQ